MDSRIECHISRFRGDTKLSGAVHMLKRRSAIQRDLDRLQKLASANNKWFSKVKCKVLHPGRGSSKDEHRSLSALSQTLQQCCDQLWSQTWGCWGGIKGGCGDAQRLEHLC